VPAQDIGPWQAALERLLSDRAHYKELSRASRETALADAASQTIDPFEDLLHHLTQSPKRWGAGLSPRGALAPPSADHLSPDRRKLLTLRLRRISGAGHLASGALRLFCFPHAGGGAAAFKSWGEHLPRSIVVIPMRTSGRKDMAELAAALCDSVQPYLHEPFAFFGHSMGAAVAFELARLLRRRNLPAPRLLVASGARAPQFRRGHVPPPEPGEAEFVDALRRLQGTPREVLDNPDLLQMVLPALREDAAIYRNYIYAEEPPLDCPIRAYGGSDDPNVIPAHLEAWALQTTAAFAVRLFPGGHFYLQTHRAEFLAALALDLTA
jgi:medium-chain acyl-[acyl-carrier-protein] hydrolase